MAKPITGAIVSEKLALPKWDEAGETWVQFQRPTRWEDEQISQLRAQAELVWDSAEQGTVRQRDSVPLMLQETKMVALCLVESNICTADDILIFSPGVSVRRVGKRLTVKQEQKFLDAWYGLDGELADEIVEKLREWHPPFDFRNPSRGEE